MNVSKVKSQSTHHLSIDNRHIPKVINCIFLGAFLLTLYHEKAYFFNPNLCHAPSNKAMKEAFQNNSQVKPKETSAMIPKDIANRLEPLYINLEEVAYPYINLEEVAYPFIITRQEFKEYLEEIKKKKDKRAFLLLYLHDDLDKPLTNSFLDTIETICITLIRGWRDNKRLENPPSYFNNHPITREKVKKVLLIECSIDELGKISFIYKKTLPLKTKKDENNLIEETFQELKKSKTDTPERTLEEAKKYIEKLFFDEGIVFFRKKTDELVKMLTTDEKTHLTNLPNTPFEGYCQLLILKYFKD